MVPRYTWCLPERLDNRSGGPGGTAEPVDLESLDPSHRDDSASAIFKCASCGTFLVLSTHRGNQVDLHMSVYQRMIPGELN